MGLDWRWGLEIAFGSVVLLLASLDLASAASTTLPSQSGARSTVNATGGPSAGAPSATMQRSTWTERFRRESPSVLRAIDGVPPPAGYSLEHRYDSRRVWSSGLAFGASLGLQLLAVLPEGIAPVEIIPCAGPFLSKDEGDFTPLLHLGFGLPACAFFLLGSIELGRTLFDVRPVWVRDLWPAQSGGLRVHGYTTGREWRVGLGTHF